MGLAADWRNGFRKAAVTNAISTARRATKTHVAIRAREDIDTPEEKES
jgi:hypothetical protein